MNIMQILCQPLSILDFSRKYKVYHDSIAKYLEYKKI